MRALRIGLLAAIVLFVARLHAAPDDRPATPGEFNVKAADYTYFEGITFRNTDIAIWAGTQAIGSSSSTSKGRSTRR